MTELIEASDGIEEIRLEASLTEGFVIAAKRAVGEVTYRPEDISEIVEVEEESRRSPANAAVWSILGGLVGGGRAGMLLGAAIGARRLKSAVYMVRFADGATAAFKQDSGLALTALRRHLHKHGDETAFIARA